SVNFAVERSAATAIFVPTMSGTAARNITRFRLPVAIVAVSPRLATVRALHFSYGVHPEYEPAFPDEWNHYARQWLADHNMPISLVLLVQGPSPRHPEANNSMQLVELGRP
ncbi:MAG: pyruvate kinase, partial [Deltaproteobacteria bacterium]|nr:pyruvate kinase [Deltaproteobacteria bacterium]